MNQYCRRRKDEYGNRHDTVVLPHSIHNIAEIIECGRTDEYRTIFSLENGKVKMIILMSFNYNAETVCHEYEIDINEMCKIIKDALKRQKKVLLEPDIQEYCPEL